MCCICLLIITDAVVIHAGIEFESGTEDAKKVLAFLKDSFPKAYAKVRKAPVRHMRHTETARTR